MLPEGPGTNNARSGRRPLLVIFFLSGASGLIYEVVWSRSLVLVFGSTTHAVSTVLAAFMGGLALGSILVGRRADRFRNPLRAYAILEIAIAVLALAVLLAPPLMVQAYRLVWSAAGGSPAALNILRFLLAGLVLLPPTTLMGATLPILSAHLERTPAARGSRGYRFSGAGAGALYAANTIGAVAGTALTGFLLLPSLGMLRSALVAAAANLAAAAAAWRLSRSVPSPAAGGAPSREILAASASGPAAIRFAVLLAVFAASGAGALIFEVVWTRILSLVLGSSTQAFTIMLTTFLAGLALGSAAATRWLPRIAKPLQALTLIELGAGLTAYTGVYLFPELPYAFMKLFEAVGDSPALFQIGRFLLAGLVMLPPTLCLGAAFPLAARAALEGRSAVAAPVAALYTSNTAGAILGSCIAGFVLIPAIGLQAALLAGCALNIAAGASLLALNPAERPVLRYGLAAVLLACLPGLVTGAPGWNSMLMSSGVFQYAPRYLKQFHSRRDFIDYHREHGQLYYKDGPTTTVAVEKRPEKVDGEVNIVLSVNGKVDASSVGDMETQVLLGQLPLLAAQDPRSVLVIGLGSGVSAGSALSHPIHKLTIVEIEPAILEAQRYFEHVNGRPLSDSRATFRINDARNDLLVSDETYDIIISEPSNPWITGPSRLFTREFFDLARSRLNEAGMLCQWVQLYGMDPGALKTLLRTYASVFPHTMVFKASAGDLLILGSDLPIRMDVSRIASRMLRPAVASDLARINLLEPADLLARYRLGEADFAAYVGEGPLNTDDNALVEFAAARSLYREDHQINDSELAAIRSNILPHLVFGEAPDEKSMQDPKAVMSQALASRLIRMGLLERAGALIDAALRDPDLPASGEADLLGLRGDLLQKRSDAAGAEAAWKAALDLNPLEPRSTLGLALRRINSGEPAAAAALLEKVPGDPLCRLALAKARLLAGDPRGALATLDRFEELGGASGVKAGRDPDAAPFCHLYRGRAHESLGDHTRAVRELKLYFDLFPDAPRPAETSIEAATDLARAHLALGQQEDAVAQFRIITGLADSLASWNRRQGTEAIDRRDLRGALIYLRAALRWNHQDAQSRRMLAYTLNDLGQYAEAVGIWRDLDKQLSGDDEALRNIAGLSLELKRPQDAIAAFRRMREMEGNPDLIRQLDEEIGRLGGR